MTRPLPDSTLQNEENPANEPIRCRYTSVDAWGILGKPVFEDDRDRSVFLSMLNARLSESDVSLLAWCLLDGCFHLLCQGDRVLIERLLQRVTVEYVPRFNGRHGRRGKVFQTQIRTAFERDEEHLRSLVRKIHWHCRAVGCEHPQDHQWNSYGEIAGESSDGLCDVDATLELFGGLEAFLAFHEDPGAEDSFGLTRTFCGSVPSTVAPAFQEASSTEASERLANARVNRNVALLREMGITSRQIQRLGVIGKGLIC